MSRKSNPEVTFVHYIQENIKEPGRVLSANNPSVNKLLFVESIKDEWSFLANSSSVNQSRTNNGATV